MDTFMCSSWYQLRYLSPDYDRGALRPRGGGLLAAGGHLHGGAEHAVMHLLYTRFFTKALRDMGVFDATAEAMRSHGRDPGDSSTSR